MRSCWLYFFCVICAIIVVVDHIFSMIIKLNAILNLNGRLIFRAESNFSSTSSKNDAAHTHTCTDKEGKIQYVHANNIWYSVNMCCGFFECISELEWVSTVVSFFVQCILFLRHLTDASHLQQRWKFTAERQDEWKIWMIDDETLFPSHSFNLFLWHTRTHCGCLAGIYKYSYNMFAIN